MNSQAIAILRGEAQRQAASGNHLAALELLDQIPEEEGMALRARILCQQSLFTAGTKCWQAVLAKAPQDEAARRGLALAERLARSSAGKLRLHARRWALGFLALVLLAAISILPFRNPHRYPSTSELAESMGRLENKMADWNSSSLKRMDALREQMELSKNASEQAHQQLQELQQRVKRLPVAADVKKLLADSLTQK